MYKCAVPLPYYLDYVSPALLQQLTATAVRHPTAPRITLVPDAACDAHVTAYLTPAGAQLLLQVYDSVLPHLQAVLTARNRDREFIDTWTRAAVAENQTTCAPFHSPDYRTVIGLTQGSRVVVGPAAQGWRTPRAEPAVAPLPEHLRGVHVTLFGPPDNPKLAINAMNCRSRKLPNEPAVVGELVGASRIVPKWGADDEDSKTPLFAHLVAAGVHLNECFDGSLVFVEPSNGQRYEIAKPSAPGAPGESVMPALPIKRIPGLALPSTAMFIDGAPVPLHLFDFVLHLAHNAHRPEALTFYVPKLENDEEAAYLATVIRTAEQALVESGLAPRNYVPGTVRIVVVLENPRAVFRVNEIMDALYPYFAGASLGWHDYLASTARLFAHDPNYRIPVKADPDIVVKHIKESHLLLADLVGARGGVKIGGMYGILPLSRDLTESSMQVTLYGYVRDVVTQLKRGLDGFWVAHPDFVRIGIAIVEAYRAGDTVLERLVRALILDPARADALMSFVRGRDVDGLNLDDPLYPRALLAADMAVSDVISNSDEAEVRYNVFQALQYLADWLAGNGCVALPTIVAGVQVRVMDDLATSERSRWELWHEVFHGRVAVSTFLRIVEEEMLFIRSDRTLGAKAVQVKVTEATAKWYPVARNLLLKLVLPASDGRIIEFATQLLLPFTVAAAREAADPWAFMLALDPLKYALPDWVLRWLRLFDACACERFASAFAHKLFSSTDEIRVFLAGAGGLSLHEVGAAADFHGDIGRLPAAQGFEREGAEQARVLAAAEAVRAELLAAGQSYRAKFGFKFLIRASGRSADELLAELKRRSSGAAEAELQAAREQLAAIAALRLFGPDQAGGRSTAPATATACELIHAPDWLAAHAAARKVQAFSLAYMSSASTLAPVAKSSETLAHARVTSLVAEPLGEPAIDAHAYGEGAERAHASASSLFQIASISKIFGAALACEFFTGSGAQSLCAALGTPVPPELEGITLDTPVARLLAQRVPGLQLEVAPELLASDPEAASWLDGLRLRHLIDHTGVGGPFVFGMPSYFDTAQTVAALSAPESGPGAYGYVKIAVRKAPGKTFGYSGAGFMLVQLLLESFAGVSIDRLMDAWLACLGLDARRDVVFGPIDRLTGPAASNWIRGHTDDGQTVPLLHFPQLAAGAWGTPSGVLRFLHRLAAAYASPAATFPLSHATAAAMLGAPHDLGAVNFQHALAGLGLFVTNAGPNQILLHQAANNGYAGLCMAVFAGPNAGCGFCVLSCGDLNGYLSCVQLARGILAQARWVGTGNGVFAPWDSFRPADWPREQVVNQAYRALLLRAFERQDVEDFHDAASVAGVLLSASGCLGSFLNEAEAGSRALAGRWMGALYSYPMQRNDWADADLLTRHGPSSIVSCSSQAFAVASNLVCASAPIFDPTAFGVQGKVMDSWETQRHRSRPPAPGYDTAVIALPPAAVSYVAVSTQFHDGNHSRFVKITGRLAGSEASSAAPLVVLPKTHLTGHAMHFFTLPRPVGPLCELTVYNYPDGGITRVHAFDAERGAQLAGFPPALAGAVAGAVVRFAEPIPLVRADAHATAEAFASQRRMTSAEAWHLQASRLGQHVDVACCVFGARLLHASNQHYGPASALLAAYRARGMFDGFESKRSRDDGHVDYAVIGLAKATRIDAILVDFSFFKNNNPWRLTLLGFDVASQKWLTLANQLDAKPYAANVMTVRAFGKRGERLRAWQHTFSKICVVSEPDGGINRLRVLASVTPELLRAPMLALDEAAHDELPVVFVSKL